MALDATARRRWFGAIVLVVALAMLICGETVLKENLRKLTFICYWLVCFGFTSLAIVVAFLDARALQRRTSQEQRDLFEVTLKEIETDATTRPRQQDRKRGGS
jgi:membrane protein implicated in regulation of membrane protease activity